MNISAETVSHIVRSTCDIAPGQPLDEGALGDLGLDSLSQLKLLFALEKHFGIRVPEETDFAAMTLRDVVESIATARRAPAHAH